jgi:hypothetical protein
MALERIAHCCGKRMSICYKLHTDSCPGRSENKCISNNEYW